MQSVGGRRLQPSVIAGPSKQQQAEEVDRWPLFTALVVVTCTMIMGLELRENAAMHDFQEQRDADCHFRLEAHWRFCAAALSTNPLFGPTAPVLLRMGGLLGTAIVDKLEVWRLVSAIFLHGGVAHLCVNMVALIGLGRQLERTHGSLRVGSIYLLSGLFGALAGATFAPNLLSVGASGAIFGLIGACLGDILFNWDTYPRPCRSLVFLGSMAGFQLLLGTLPMLDNFAHTFGFGMGTVSSLALLRRLNPGEHCCATCSRHLLRTVAACCVVLAFVTMAAVMFGVRGADAKELCPECARISCMAFPWGCEQRDPVSCWWTCTPKTLECTGQASFTEDERAGTVEIGCSGASEPITVRPVDVSDWSEDLLGRLCQDHCM